MPGKPAPPHQSESSIEESLDQKKFVAEHVDERRQRGYGPRTWSSHCGRKASSRACRGGRNQEHGPILDRWNHGAFAPTKEEGSIALGIGAIVSVLVQSYRSTTNSNDASVDARSAPLADARAAVGRSSCRSDVDAIRMMCSLTHRELTPFCILCVDFAGAAPSSGSSPAPPT